MLAIRILTPECLADRWLSGSRTQLTAAVLVKLARVRGLGHRLHFRDFRIRLAITSAPDDRPSFSSEFGGIPSGSRGLWFSQRSG